MTLDDILAHADGIRQRGIQTWTTDDERRLVILADAYRALERTIPARERGAFLEAAAFDHSDFEWSLMRHHWEAEALHRYPDAKETS